MYINIKISFLGPWFLGLLTVWPFGFLGFLALPLMGGRSRHRDCSGLRPGMVGSQLPRGRDPHWDACPARACMML